VTVAAHWYKPEDQLDHPLCGNSSGAG